MERFYLAYGSNLNLEQMAYRCPDAEIVGTSEIKDYELVYRRGVLTIEPKKGSTVPVGVWAISERDEISLNRYEGYPRWYRKANFVVDVDGDPTLAMVYIMNDGYPIQPPTEFYFETCLQGYMDFGFDIWPFINKTREAIDTYKRNRS